MTYPLEYKSAVDMWLGALLIGVPVITILAIMPAVRQAPPAVLAMLSLGVLIPILVSLSLLLGTKYVLGEELLLVRSGPFSWKIPVSKILHITPSSSLISSPALSLDRLQINYETESGQPKSILISPAEKEEFIRNIAEHPQSSLKDGSVLETQFGD